MPGRQELIKHIVDGGTELIPHLYSFYIQDTLQAVALRVEHNGYWYCYSSAVSQNAPENLQLVYNVHGVRMAIEHKMHTYDAASGSFGWKEKLHLDTLSQYSYTSI